uniref:ubiquitinyl hydrolase 1 n=1 Tax=Ditylenchus dipsaci TaxID=166011 RepID=A0A915ENE5_9BILA
MSSYQTEFDVTLKCLDNQEEPPEYSHESTFQLSCFLSQEVKGVITHKGRASNSGHYVAWVRVKGNRWAMGDDDEVHPVAEEDVLKLSGGSDWHCAYVLLYGPRPLPQQS